MNAFCRDLGRLRVLTLSLFFVGCLERPLRWVVRDVDAGDPYDSPNYSNSTDNNDPTVSSKNPCLTTVRKVKRTLT